MDEDDIEIVDEDAMPLETIEEQRYLRDLGYITEQYEE